MLYTCNLNNPVHQQYLKKAINLKKRKNCMKSDKNLPLLWKSVYFAYTFKKGQPLQNKLCISSVELMNFL